MSSQSSKAMTLPDRNQVLAASAGWVAVLLNVVPGLGAGYLYQRRWKAYWITSALATRVILFLDLLNFGIPVLISQIGVCYKVGRH